MKTHEIKYLLGQKGIKFTDIDKKYGLRYGTARRSVSQPHQDAEVVLAEILGVELKQLFPTRYDDKGKRLRPQPAKNYVYKKMQDEHLEELKGSNA